MINQIDLLGVEFFGQLLLRQCHAYRHGKALAQGACRGLHPGAFAELRMTSSLGVELPEVLQVLKADVIAS